MESVENLREQANNFVDTIGTTSNADEPFERIDEANKFVTQIDETIKQLYKTVKEVYSKRFPELNVSNPMEYMLIVQILENEPAKILRDEIKNQLNVLEPKIQLLVSMAAPTTQGVKLEDEEIHKILKACQVALELNNLRKRFINFVELNMTRIAPNLCFIVGAPIAAKLMCKAGGLMELATLNPSNWKREAFIIDCDLIKQIPFDNVKVRKQACGWISNKCALAARCDLNKSDSLAEAGRMFRKKIETFIDKSLEPPPKKAVRPLPAPIEKTGKRRGGKRSRRMKERFAKTELRKAANRINFGDVADDAYQA